ncbi:hypothetical protein LWI28_020020 [Acer negundo]|uniref:Glycoside hydrolase family 31 N-terminal domain-containing protein n=1 Tax=Acer negundo TaxID=4023 RepID=A0AAD5IV30_ACENE|nr:hypothetical protein LWI28_020020 [Acer negundo]
MLFSPTSTASITRFRKRRHYQKLTGRRLISKMADYGRNAITTDVISGNMVFQPILEDRVFRFDCSGNDRDASYPSLSFVNSKDRETPISHNGPIYTPIYQCHMGQQIVKLELPVGTSFYGTGEVSGQLERTGKRIFTWNTDAWGYGPGTTSLYQSHPWVLAVLPNGEALGVLADTTQRCEIKFKENIRGYNSIFSFTSTGAKVDKTINVGGSPYVYCISRQNHHLMGSLLPTTEEKPKFAQLYIYDTEDEVMNRLWALSGDNTLSSRLEFDIVSELVKMFDECNGLAKVFKMARDHFKASEFILIRLRLMRSRSNDSNVYNLPTRSEVATLIVGDLDDNVMRDIIVEHKSDGLQRISELHPSFMAMQYPLLFPYGEDSFQLGIKYITNDGKRKTKRQCVTIREYYAYRL